MTEMLGIRHPILCGGMGPGISDASYVAAVVNAGGVGFIVASGYPDADQFSEELRKCRQLTSGKRFGVNLYISGQPDAARRLQEQIRILADEDVFVSKPPGGAPRQSFRPFKSPVSKCCTKSQLFDTPGQPNA